MKDLCLIVEDQSSTREFLKDVTAAAFPALEINAVTSLKEAAKFLDRPVNTAIVDIGLPDGSGIDFIQKLSEKQPRSKSIVVTIYGDDDHLFAALAAGAYGYVLKEDDSRLMINTLKRMDNNEPPLSPSIALRLLNHFRTNNSALGPEIELTSREKETLSLIARGHTVAEAAKQMGLSAQTVASYVKVIYQKLHVSSRAEATREAIRRGLA